MVELWIPMVFVRPEEVATKARQLEGDGWDGITLADTQCLFGDPFVQMTAAVIATSQLRVTTATSNPLTRHPSVIASAIASVAAIAPGRVMLGIGRGDSAIAYIGGAPATVEVFERYVSAVRRYLHGEPVPFDALRDWPFERDLASIELGSAPVESQLRWLDSSVPTVPVQVFATGPRVIKVGGWLADRVTFGLGADVVRLQWAVELAREACAESGGDPLKLALGSAIPIGVADDMDRARRSVANMVASEARFAVMSGRVVGPMLDPHRRVYESVALAYDMNKHGGSGAQVDVLTDDFIDEFAIVGPPSRCIERILELIELGLDHLMLAPPQGDADEDDKTQGYRRLVEEVLPSLRT
jgi:5,10-methylenetetrahydromethanopterin reductase